MSLTKTVPAPVPSLFQSSLPLVPSFATKNNVPPKLIGLSGSADDVPERISFTNTVPPEVPSLFQSSLPLLPAIAAKGEQNNLIAKEPDRAGELDRMLRNRTEELIEHEMKFFKPKQTS